MNAEEVQALLAELFAGFDDYAHVDAIGPMSAELSLPMKPEYLRPGGTISGPTLMGLADTAMYAALLGEIGPVAQAVTVNLTINFLRRPRAGDLIARARLMKLGKRLAFGEIEIAGHNAPDEIVAHATCTYAIPATR